MSDNDLAGVEPRLAAAYGRAAWGTALGVGRFLTVEFGAQRAEPDPGRRVHGEFHLWVYCSAWRIDTPRDIVAASEDRREHLETAVPYLDGRTLSAIPIQPPSLSTVFEFGEGPALRTFSIFSKEDEHWMFYLPDGTVFTAGPGATWSWVR